MIFLYSYLKQQKLTTQSIKKYNNYKPGYMNYKNNSKDKSKPIIS